MSRYQGGDLEEMRSVVLMPQDEDTSGESHLFDVETPSPSFTPINSSSPTLVTSTTPRPDPEPVPTQRVHRPMLAEYLGLGDNDGNPPRFKKSRRTRATASPNSGQPRRGGNRRGQALPSGHDAIAQRDSAGLLRPNENNSEQTPRSSPLESVYCPLPSHSQGKATPTPTTNSLKSDFPLTELLDESWFPDIIDDLFDSDGENHQEDTSPDNVVLELHQNAPTTPSVTDYEFGDGTDDDEILAVLESTNQYEHANAPSSPLASEPTTPSFTGTPPSAQPEPSKCSESYKPLINPGPKSTGSDDGPVDKNPIVRPPFPSAVRDRSPIIGLSSRTVLRTCFRIGEAINVGCSGARSGKDVFIELYARVMSSWRGPGSIKQDFILCDLYHDRKPHIHGTYALWKGAELWDYDSSRLLDSKMKKCRCIGKMVRDGTSWHFLILNIWEATWDDVDYVKGIVCS